MKIISCSFFGKIWIFITIFIYSNSQEVFKEFTKSICGDQCKIINCPTNTVMKVQLVEVSYGGQNQPKCMSEDSSNNLLNENEEPENCKQLLKVFWSQYIDSSCSNKSECRVCETKDIQAKYKRCTLITDIIVSYLCISKDIMEEKILENTYFEINCESQLDHRIIIHKASLLANYKSSNIFKKSNHNEKPKDCSQVDVSSIISKKCSFLTKCQAGPDQLVTNGCEKKQLLLQYACVPEFVLKLENSKLKYSIESDILSVTGSSLINNDGIQLLFFTTTSIKQISSKNEENIEDKLIWIITGISIFVVLTMIFGAFIWSFGMRKWRNRQSSLFHKIKDANFCPPPTPIDKIQIDLSPRDPLCTDHSKDYNTLLHNEVIHQLQCSQINCEHYANTICANHVYIHSNPITNSSISSNAAGSSGQISSPHSDSSKGNPSTIFNYLTSERHPPVQTYI